MQYSDVEYETEYFPNNTIDIEFSGVEHISIPTNFEKIEIMRNGDKFIFNGNSSLYVIASSCLIGTSHWGHDEGRFSDLSLKYDSAKSLE
jgi:hypothetical protein